MKLLTPKNLFRLGNKATWYNAELHKPSLGEAKRVTLISGIGIGPEITSTYVLMKNAFWMYLRQLMSLLNST